MARLTGGVRAWGLSSTKRNAVVVRAWGENSENEGMVVSVGDVLPSAACGFEVESLTEKACNFHLTADRIFEEHV